MSYQQEFRQIGMKLMDNDLDWQEWIELYKKLVYWELNLAESNDVGIFEVLKQQKQEANNQFSKYYQQNYTDWISKRDSNSPEFSHTLLKNKLFPELNKDEKSNFLIIIDNFRFDQWKIIQTHIEQYFRVEQENILLQQD
jgi:hypothetical protein